MAMSWAAAWACYRPAPFASSHRTAAGDAGGFHRPAHGCRRQLVPATPARPAGPVCRPSPVHRSTRAMRWTSTSPIAVCAKISRPSCWTAWCRSLARAGRQPAAQPAASTGRQAAERLPDARLLPRRTRIDELLDVAELPHAWQALTALQSDPDELLAESAHALSTGCPLALILSGSNSGVPGNCR